MTVSRFLLLPTLALLAAGCSGATFHPSDRVDADGDGFFAVGDLDGLEGLTVSDLLALGLDCDDNNDDIFPGAAELCDGEDNNCDGSLATVEDDADGDGYTECGWDPGAGELTTETDCNDDPNNAGNLQNPGRAEVCAYKPSVAAIPPGNESDQRIDGLLDDDCDGALAEGEIDADLDGHAAGCELVDLLDGDIDALDVDCNDNVADINPSVPAELAACVDGSDLGTNCLVVPDSERFDWVPDRDLDSDGDSDDGLWLSLCAGTAPSGSYIQVPFGEEPGDYANDCDDLNPQINGLDADGDAFSTCQSDCDDGNEDVFPGADEICDRADNDCNGDIDEIFDNDNDGSFTDPDPTAPNDVDLNGCVEDYGAGGIDCDDNDASANQNDLDTDGSSTCDGDCNDLNAQISFTDADGDGYNTCAFPVDCDDADPGQNHDDADLDGVTSCAGDCDDNEPGRFPGAAVQCDGLFDTDCDTFEDPLEADDDNDGATECTGDCNDADPLLNTSDEDGDGVSTCGGDCNDDPSSLTAADTFPGAPTVCDAEDDNDCNGAVDTNQADFDQDGSDLCDEDCNDFDPDIENLDADGDGSTTCEGDCLDSASDPLAPLVNASTDGDGDGWTFCGSFGAADPISAAVPPDCDDGDGTANWTDADGDSNTTCDAEPDCDDFDPVANELDVDSDNESSCEGDCDDHTGFVNSTLSESRDGRDNDCSGTADEGLIDEGDLAIVEILIAADPASGDGFAEYVEVYNGSGADVDLRGWEVEVTNDATGTSAIFTFPSEPGGTNALVVGDGERGVLARSANINAFGTDIADIHWAAAAFGDAGGSVALSYEGDLVDEASWGGSDCNDNCGTTDANPSFSGDNTWRVGHSIGLSQANAEGGNAHTLNDSVSNWCEEQDPLAPNDFGSPGTASNSPLGACTD